MVTSEYTVIFKEEIGEFNLMLIGKLGDDFAISPNFKQIVIETDLDEREFIRLLSELVDVEKIGIIEYKRTLEPDWIGYEINSN